MSKSYNLHVRPVVRRVSAQGIKKKQRDENKATQATLLLRVWLSKSKTQPGDTE